MEWYQLLSVVASISIGLISIISVVLWYIIRSTVEDMRSLQKELTDHKLSVEKDLKEYAKTHDIRDIMKRLEEMQATINNVAINIATLAGKMHTEVANI